MAAAALKLLDPRLIAGWGVNVFSPSMDGLLDDPMDDSPLTADFAADLNTWLENDVPAGAIIDFEGRNWPVSTTILHTEGLTFRNGWIVPHASLMAATYDTGFAVTLVRAENQFTAEASFGVDGLAQEVDNLWLTGIENAAAIADWVRLLGPTRRLSFKGVNIHDNIGAWTNGDVTLGGQHEDFGWEAVAAQGAREVTLMPGFAIRTFGYNGLNLIRAKKVLGDRRVDKSGTPHRVYDGPGSFDGEEAGGCVVTMDDSGWLGDEYLKGKASGSPGDLYVLSESGRSGAPSTRSIGRSHVEDTDLGGGIDVTSGMQRHVTIKNCEIGLLLTKDSGGDIEDFAITGDIDGSASAGMTFHPARTDITRSCTVVSGQSSITITGGGNGYIVPGMRVTGTGIGSGARVAATYNHLAQSSTVPLADGNGDPVLNTSTPGSPVTIAFEGYIVWRRGRIDVSVTNSLWAARIYDCSDDSDYGYEDVEIRIRAKNIDETGVVEFFPGGVVPRGLHVIIESESKDVAKAVSGSSIDVTVAKLFRHYGGGTLNRLTGGQAGDEVIIIFNDAATANMDFANAGSWGLDRLIGNDNTDITIGAGDMLVCRKRSDDNGDRTPWFVQHIPV